MHCDKNNTILCGCVCPLEETMHDGHPRDADVFLLHKDGQRVPVRVQSMPLRDENGTIIGAAECFDLRVVLPAAVVPLRPGAGVSADSVTELPDRGAMLSQVAEALRNFAESRIPFGVLSIAIDNLDSLLHKDGRNAADAVLYATGQTLRANVGPNDAVGRWSADRFVAVLTSCTAGTLAKAAGALGRLANSEAIPWWGDHLSVTVSMGGTIVRADDTPKSLVQRADDALEIGRVGSGGPVVVT
jgi:diguanylate cyclase (GGDEF)-like protein